MLGRPTVRARQLATLTNTIETRSGNRAVLLSGDFNAPPKRGSDHRNLMHAVTALGPTDTGARPTNRASDPCRVIRTFSAALRLMRDESSNA